jgi:hypothetical protein
MNLALPPGLIAQEGKEVPTTAEEAPLRPEEIDQLMAPASCSTASHLMVLSLIPIEWFSNTF